MLLRARVAISVGPYIKSNLYSVCMAIADLTARLPMCVLFNPDCRVSCCYFGLKQYEGSGYGGFQRDRSCDSQAFIQAGEDSFRGLSANITVSLVGTSRRREQ